jgi:hypothetical protein
LLRADDSVVKSPRSSLEPLLQRNFAAGGSSPIKNMADMTFFPGFLRRFV